MGSLRDFDIAKLKERFRLRVLVETGTGEGHSLKYALESVEWDEVHTIESDWVTHERVARNAHPIQTQLWYGRSVDILPEVLAEIAGKGPCLFWLDAHFPGELSGAPLDAEADADVRLPLEKELKAITMIRTLSELRHDLFIIDDAWIYRDGLAECGDWEHRREIADGALDWFVERYLMDTHVILQDPRANGYTIAVPKLAARYVLEDCLGEAAKKLREF